MAGALIVCESPGVLLIFFNVVDESTKNWYLLKPVHPF